jgi:hypothetical protein
VSFPLSRSAWRRLGELALAAWSIRGTPSQGLAAINEQFARRWNLQNGLNAGIAQSGVESTLRMQRVLPAFLMAEFIDTLGGAAFRTVNSWGGLRRPRDLGRHAKQAVVLVVHTVQIEPYDRLREWLERRRVQELRAAERRSGRWFQLFPTDDNSQPMNRRCKNVASPVNDIAQA